MKLAVVRKIKSRRDACNLLSGRGFVIARNVILISLTLVMGLQFRLLSAVLEDDKKTQSILIGKSDSSWLMRGVTNDTLIENSGKSPSSSRVFYFGSSDDWKGMKHEFQKHWYTVAKIHHPRSTNSTNTNKRLASKLNAYEKGSFNRYRDQCEELVDWQHYSFPVCNVIHEVDFISRAIVNPTDVVYLGRGGVRDVWKLHNGSTKSEETVLKTLRWYKEFEPRYYRMHNTDALAMERLTRSPYVVDIFAYCGNSAINEMSSNTTLRGLIREEGLSEHFIYNAALSIVKSLVDVHQLDGPGSKPSIIHGDVGPSNFVVFKKGNEASIKLNDFNGARLIKWDPELTESCAYRNGFVCASGGGAQKRVDTRSPEECLDEVIDEALDVWGIGVMLFTLLTNQRPYYFDDKKGVKFSTDEIRERIVKGQLPSLPKTIIRSKSPIIIGVLNAMKKAFTLNKIERPSANDLLKDLYSMKPIIDNVYP